MTVQRRPHSPGYSKIQLVDRDGGFWKLQHPLRLRPGVRDWRSPSRCTYGKPPAGWLVTIRGIRRWYSTRGEAALELHFGYERI